MQTKKFMIAIIISPVEREKKKNLLSHEKISLRMQNSKLVAALDLHGAAEMIRAGNTHTRGIMLPRGDY